MSSSAPPAPLLYLDIDGVLNAFGIDRDDVVPPHFVAQVAGCDVVLDRRHPDWLRELEQHFEVFWASMWQRDSVDYFAPALGWGEHLPYLEFWDSPVLHGPTVAYIKLPVIQEHAGARPYVWVDDDLTDWLVDQADGVRSHHLTTDPSEGLTEHHVASLTKLATELRRLPSEPSDPGTKVPSLPELSVVL